MWPRVLVVAQPAVEGVAGDERCGRRRRVATLLEEDVETDRDDSDRPRL